MAKRSSLAGRAESRTWVNRNPDDEMDYIKKVSGGVESVNGVSRCVHLALLMM